MDGSVVIPAELAGESVDDGLRRVQQILRQYADLLTSWQQILSATRELKEGSADLLQPLD